MKIEKHIWTFTSLIAPILGRVVTRLGGPHPLNHVTTWSPEKLYIHTFRKPMATKLAGLTCNFIKIETLAQVFSCEFCEISKNTFFTEHLQATASMHKIVILQEKSKNYNLCIH